MPEEQFFANRTAHPLGFFESIRITPDELVERAPSQLLEALKQESISQEDRAKLFAGICHELGRFAFNNPELQVEVEWEDDMGLPTTLVTTPTDAIRLTAVKNILIENSPVK